MVLGGGIMNLTKHYYLVTVVSRPNHGYATASARLSRGLDITVTRFIHKVIFLQSELITCPGSYPGTWLRDISMIIISFVEQIISFNIQLILRCIP